MKILSVVLINIFVSINLARPLIDSQLGLNEVLWQPESTRIYLGSPSLLQTINCDPRTNRWLASHDLFGSGFRSMPRNATVYESIDGGANWQLLSVAKDQYWSNLFSLSTDLYILGTSSDTEAAISIHRSSDCGLTWKEGSYLFNGSYATGPTPTVVHNGRVYRALEYWAPPNNWPTDFQAVIISAPVTSDLLSPSSWTITPPVPFNQSWIPAQWGKLEEPGYLEGNVVIGPDGSIYNILRVNSIPLVNKACMLKLVDNKLVFQQFLEFPGGMSKFVIRRDPITLLYITLSNNVTDPSYPLQRNVLTLSYSKDIVTWKLVEDHLLWDDTGFPWEDSVAYTGFQYVDWQIDGDDILYLVRTSYRGANSYHNSNRMTTKRVKNFRNLLKY